MAVKVSVVMPVYNAAPYLREALDSLLRQTLKDIEIIPVDDGSTDESLAILNEYAQRDARVKPLHQENTGAGAARNNGLAKASGEYVIFLDGDDFFADTLLEKTWSAGVKNKADVVLFSARTYDDKTKVYGPEHAYLRKDFLPAKTVFSGDDIPDKILVITSPAPWLRLLRTAFVRENKLYYQNIPNSNDHFFTTISMAVAKRVCAVQEDLVFYRINNSSSLQGKRKKHNLCFMQAIEAIYDELNRRGLYEKYRLSFMHSAFGCIRDKIVRTGDVAARNEILDALCGEGFQRMQLLGKDEGAYGNKWLYDRAEELNQISKWHDHHKKQLAPKEHQLVVPRKSQDKPLISVIVPIYNVAEYLTEALESVSAQTLKDLEIVCVDDGSTDDSLKIAVEYAKQEPRMSIYHHENSGPSQTRNAALEVAQGQYVYFMDSDDKLVADALETLMDRMQQDQLDMVLFDGASFNSGGYEGIDLKYVRKKPYEGVKTGPEMFEAMRTDNQYSSSPCMYMMKMELVTKYNMRFYPAILHEDQLFTAKVMLLAERVGHVGKALYLRRLHDDSIMTRSVAFRNVYGYFYAWKGLNALIEQYSDRLTDSQKIAFYSQVSAILSTMQTGYSQLPAGERFCRYAFGTEEPLFASIVVKMADKELECERKLAAERAKLKAGQKGHQPSGKPAQRVLLFAPGSNFLKRIAKKIIPVSYSRAGFQAQVLADMIYNVQRAVGIQTEKQMKLAEAQNNLMMRRSEALEKQLTQQEQRIEALEKLLAKTLEQSTSANGNAGEAVWAEVFNNTVQKSAWLRDTSFSAGRWAVGYQFLYVLYRALNEIHPANVLELGLGQSTKMISQYAASIPGVKHEVVEADAGWVDFFKNNYDLPQATQIVRLDYEMIDFMGDKVRVYKDFAKAVAGKKYNLISIDAPLGGDMKKYSRIDVFMNLPQILADQFIIMIDDTNRKTEANMAGLITHKLQDEGIAFKLGRYRGQKETIIICSPDIGFLCTM